MLLPVILLHANHQRQDAAEPQPIKRAQLRMLNLHCGDKRNVQAFGLSFNASVQSAILLVLDLMTLLNHVRHLAVVCNAGE